MDTLNLLLQYVLHIDSYLMTFVANYGFWTYILLFLIIFCETGLVVTPFLPGDSLLFAAGSIAASDDNALSLQVLITLLIIASILGNKVNYLIGRFVGPRVFSVETSPSPWKKLLLNRQYLEEAHRFYEKHGGKTIIFARFIPIIRTFAPFVAGIGAMRISQFTVYNIVSAFLWIGSLLSIGYFFGTLPFIKQNFTIVIYGIIALSLLPPILTLIYRKTIKMRVS